MRKKTLLLLSTALFISGCSFNDGQNNTDFTLLDSDTQKSILSSAEEDSILNIDGVNITDKNSEQIYHNNFPTYDEIQSEYPDKTILTWIFEGNMYDMIKNIRTRELNAYLDKQGYDFVLCFEASKTMTSDEKYAYINFIRGKIDSNEPVDIICNSARFVTDKRAEGITPYNAAVYAGIMEPLDKYLEEEKRQKLYQLMPENFWKSLEINGTVYGFNGYFDQLSYDFGYYVNKQLADQYGFDIEKPISDQINILKTIKENENIDVVAALNMDKMREADSFGASKQLIDGVCIEDGEIKSVLDSQSYKETLRLFNTLLSKGLLSYLNLNDNHKESAFIITDSKQAGAIAYKNQEIVQIDYFGTKIECIPVFDRNTSVKTASVATGICAFSKNKDKAFEAMSLILTDPYINNLLSYGLEGEDYAKSGNYIVLDPVHGHPYGELRFANKMLCCPVAGDYENASDIYASAFNYGNANDLGFVFDGRNVENEIIAVTFVIQNDLSKLLIANDFDVEIESLEQNLTKAGLNTIIDECKRQYVEWKKSGANE